MKKLYAVAATVMTLSAVVFAAPVFADSPGQLASGPDLYQVKNVTKGGNYAASTTATCNDVVKYSIKLANSEFGQLTNVRVQAPLSGAMTASATNAANQPTSVTASVTVTASQGTLVYRSGSTVNLNVNGGTIANLPDGITAGGVTKGTLAGSTREFVQFEAVVKCDTPPVVADIKVCEIATKKVITIKENQFDAAKHTRDLSRCNETPVTPAGTTPTTKPTPTVLPNTGAGETLALLAAVTIGGVIAHRLVWTRFNG